MGEVFADTGYRIAIVNPRDGLHQRAQSIARQLGPNQIVTSEMVLAEFLNHMSQLGQHDRRLSIETVRRLRANSALEIVPQTSTQFWAATGRYGERLDQRWSLTDCASFLIMEARGIRETLGSVVNCIFPSFAYFRHSRGGGNPESAPTVWYSVPNLSGSRLSPE